MEQQENLEITIAPLATDLPQFTYLSFGLLVSACVGVHLWVQKTKSNIFSGNNPQFIQFQHRFFVVYFLALFSDWLQGPYVYKLYSYYGFVKSQIAVLYVVGFASSVVFGTSTGTLADRFGRKKMCIAFSIMYSICCLTKLSRSFHVLLLGRIFGGIATSMLFSTFESWYVYEHVERHDFPTEWLPVTFSRITFWNGILAINAGIVANVSADGLDFGPVAPFMLAIPCLIAGGFIVLRLWPENYGNSSAHFCASCREGLRLIVTDKKVLLLGIIQSLFESVMYIFVFLWTPILDPAKPPLGMVFSSFMVSIMIGSSLYQILLSENFNSSHTLFLAVLLGLVSMVTCVISTHGDNSYVVLSYVSFLVLEFAVGLYYPSIGFLRSRIIPESHRASIMNWFRVPMNMITCAGLLWLHSDTNMEGNQTIFAICAILLAMALLAVKMFSQRLKPNDVKDPDEESLVKT